jgi:hypothetical protein
VNDFETVEPKRDRWGRYLITPADGGKAVAMTRATTVASAVDDTTGLQKWMKRQVALGMGLRPDLVAAAATTEAADKSALLRIAEDAMDAAGSSAAATVGTALHRATELADLGRDVPEMFAERIAEYRRALTAAGVEVCLDAVEQVHVLWEQQVAGMADRHVTVNGRRYIFDLKTGASIHPHGFAIQLAIYAHADHLFVPGTEELLDMPEIDRDRAIICHLPATGGPCTLHWIDIAAGWEAFEKALWVREWRKRRDLLEPLRESAEVIADAFPGTVVDEAQTAALLTERQGRVLVALPPVDDAFKARWRSELPDVRGPKQSTTWTHDDLDAIERAFELPFTDAPVPAPTVVETAAPVVELRPAPDLGGPVDPGALQMLRDRARRQSNGVKAWVRRWQEEATAVDAMQWKMGRGSHVTLWSFEVSRAALYLARVVEQAETPEAGLEVVRRCLMVVVGDLAGQAGVEVGDVLAHLSLDEATRLADLATTVDTDGPGSLEVAS